MQRIRLQTSLRQLYDDAPPKKALIFVSPGRCGTTRISEILKEKLPSDKFAVTHQMPFSRVANVAGNLMYYFGQSEKIKEQLYNYIVSQNINGRHFITTDPLTAMILPKRYINNANVCIVHITRDFDCFAESFFRFSRIKLKSFIAHNFIPFWQLGILPLENILRSGIKNKYILIGQRKESFFDSMYNSNPNYLKIDVNEIFKTRFLEILVKQFFNHRIFIEKQERFIRANETKGRIV